MENEVETQTDEKELIRRARKNFIALAVAYFLGVFNDNFFKQAICLMAVGIGKSSFQGDATILFSLPFLLFAAPAGWLSDKYSKRSVVVWGKILEFVAMCAGAYGIIYENWPCIFVMLFIMAAQSTIVSPALNGAIPELYPKSYVTKANSIVKLVSTSAILAGIAFAGPMIEKKGSDELQAIEFSVNNLTEPREFIESLKSNKDEVSKLILSQLDPIYLNLEKETTASISGVVGQQLQGFKNTIFGVFGGAKSELSQSEIFQGQLKLDIITKINSMLKSGQLKELIKDEKFYINESEKIKNDKTSKLEPIYFDALISRKYIENQFPSNLKIIEITKLGKKLIAYIIVLTAIFGYIVSLYIPKLKAANTSNPFPIWGPLNTIKVVINIRKDYLLGWTFFGSSCFYSIANLLVLNINSMGVKQFHFSFLNTSLLVVALLCGICIGSLIAGFIATEKGWFKILPPALFIMGVFAVLIYFTPQISSDLQYYYLVFLMIILGSGGGLFIIPSESFCQTRPEPARKGEVLAAHNFVDFTGILISGIAYYILEAIFPKQSNCMAFLGVVIIVLSIIFFVAFLNVAEKEKKREGALNDQ